MDNTTREQATDRIAFVAGVCDALGASWSHEAFVGTRAHTNGMRAVADGRATSIPSALEQTYPDGDLAVHPFGTPASPDDVAAVSSATGRPIPQRLGRNNALIRSHIRRHLIRQGVAMDLVYPPNH